MFGKLIRRDMGSAMQSMLITAGISLLCFLMAKAVHHFDNSFCIFLYAFLSGGSIGCAAGVLIAGVLHSWTRFRQNMYLDQAYLVQTLPVSRTTIFAALICSGILSVVVSVLFFACMAGMLYGNADLMESVHSMIEAWKAMGQKPGLLITLMVLTIVLEVLFILFVGYTGIVLGYRRNSGQFLCSVLIAIGLYFVLSAILVVVVLTASRFSDSLQTLFMSSYPDPNGLITAIAICDAGYFLYCCLLLAAMQYILKQGINID